MLQIGAVCLPKAGEEISGDAWAATSMAGGRTLIIVADGLGHGPLAADASIAALAAFHDEAPSGRGPADILGEIHRRLRSTRGAAVAIAEISPASEELRFAGLGNVAATVISGGSRRGLVSHNGIAGGTPAAAARAFLSVRAAIAAGDGIRRPGDTLGPRTLRRRRRRTTPRWSRRCCAATSLAGATI